MSFFNDLKDRLSMNRGQGADYPQNDGYDEFYDEDGAGEYGEDAYQDPSDSYGRSSGGYRGSYSGAAETHSNGVLGQTHRGEAESVAVYTRSGQLVGDADRHATTYTPPARETSYDAAHRPGAYDTPSTYAATAQRREQAAPAASSVSETEARVSAVVNATPQLPAFILRPESYDDVETVVRRVRTRQPVALVFVGVRTEVAKRVLDFSYGFACGLGASVREVGDRVFMVLPQGCELKDTDVAKLKTEGYLK